MPEITKTKPTVLFICTGNSARSQMAEAILRHLAGDRYSAESAGVEPKGVHPLTLEVLDEVGVSTKGLRSKDIKEFLGRKLIQHAIIVCDKAQQSCPRVFPFAQSSYWPFEDPAAFEGTEDERRGKFREVRDAIEVKIRAWLVEQRA